MPSYSVISSERGYIAVKQDENLQRVDKGSSVEDSDSESESMDSNYEEMQDLDNDIVQDTSSTAGLNDLDQNVQFWVRSKPNCGLCDHAIRWLRRRSKKLSRLEIVLGCIASILALLLVIFICISPKNNANVCTTRACVQVASKIVSAMDESVDPCTDFYQFSCGGWKKSNPIPAGYAQWGVFNIQLNNIKAGLKNLLERESPNKTEVSSERKAKVFYSLCRNLTAINTQGARPLLELIDSVGGWNISGVWSESNFNLNSMLKRVAKLGISPLFSFSVGTDLFSVKNNILKVGVGGLSLQSRKFYINKTLDDDMLKAYHEFMVEICVLLGGSKNESSLAMQEVLLLEQQLAGAMIPLEEARKADKYYKRVNVSHLQKQAPVIEWLEFFNTMFDTVLADQKLNGSEPVGTMSGTYLPQMSGIVRNTPVLVLNNYIIWHLVATYIPSLGQEFINARNKINKIMYGSDMQCIERWRSCVASVDTVLGLALGKMFVENEFDNSSKAMAQSMVTEIKQAFKRNLPHTTWMDGETRMKAKGKVEAVRDMIGFPDYILNQTKIDEEYKNYQISENDTYFEIVLRYYKFLRIKGLDDLRKPVDDDQWEMTPPTINAYYAPTKNIIAFPAGILQPPAYSNSYPQSVNFGGIGVVVGHELSHGFDDQGRMFDSSGNLKNWWKNETAQKFKRKTECMIKQYSKFSIAGDHINGNLTVGENIADNGGLRLAYDAYRHWRKGPGNEDDPLLPSVPYTHEQLFFISFAQLWCSVRTPQYQKDEILTNVHSPPRVRVAGTMSNSREFARAFSCPSGSPMNPIEKCKVW